MTTPALLAFDAATDRLYLGLCLGARQWHDEAGGGPGASAALVGRLMDLLSRADIGLRDLDAIAFGQGPGAFTGLRTACAVAQGLALGTGLPLLAIDTLLAVAEDARLRCGTGNVWSAMDARMGEVYAGHYAHDGRSWRTLAEPALLAPRQLAEIWRASPPQAIAGNALSVHAELLSDRGAAVLHDARPCGPALLTCARSAWASSALVDPAAAAPSYLRNRVALTTAQRVAAMSPAAARR